MRLLIALVAAFVFAPAAHAAGSFHSSDPGLNPIWAGSVQTAVDMLAPGPLQVDWRAGRADRPPDRDSRRRGARPLPVRRRRVGDRPTFDAVDTAPSVTQREMLRWFAERQRGDGAIPCSPIFGGS